MTSPISGHVARPGFDPPGLSRSREAPAHEVTDTRHEREDRSTPRVLELLAAGHFKGVADVRLRIAHADRLRELQLAAEQDARRGQQARLDEANKVLSEFVAANLTGVEETDAAVAETVAGFQDELASTASAEAVAAAIEAFAAALAEVLKLPEPYVAADAMPGADSLEVEPPAEPVDRITALAEALRALFAGTSPAAAPALPTLSEPGGAGRAYEKFLAMYRATQEPSPAEPVVDLSA